MKQIKNSLISLALLLGSIYASAQTISVTATITDPDTTVWANGHGSVFLYSPNGPPFYLGNPVSTVPQSFTLNGSGALAVSLNNTSTITPVSAVYRWSLCPNASAPCQTFDTPVTTTDLSTLLNTAIIAPRFHVLPGTFGYTDTEAIPSLPGGIYYNVTTPALRVWSGTTWTSVSGGGSGCTAIGGTGVVQAASGTAGGCQATSATDNGTVFAINNEPLSVGKDINGAFVSTMTNANTETGAYVNLQFTDGVTGNTLDMFTLGSGFTDSTIFTHSTTLLYAEPGLTGGIGMYTGGTAPLKFGTNNTVHGTMNGTTGQMVFDSVRSTDGFSGTCAPTTTATVVGGIITGCS